MRADRLLALLLTLQAQGQMPAPELAHRLGVSVRTVYRDVEALSLSGVPVYALPGRNGGVALDEAYRLALGGLSAADLNALILADASAPLAQLGIGESGAVVKLLGMLNHAQQQDAAFVRQRLYIDPTGWEGDEHAPHLAALQQAVWQDRRVRFEYVNWNGQAGQRLVDPYALVFKAGRWYLIAENSGGQMRVYRVGRMIDLAVDATTFRRRGDFDVVAYWQETGRRFFESVAVYPVTLVADATTVEVVQMLLPGRCDVVKRHETVTRMTARFSSFEEARTLMLGLGAGAWVVEPVELRQAVVAVAEGLLRSYAERDGQAI